MQVILTGRKCAKPVFYWVDFIVASALCAPALANIYNFIPDAGTTPNASVPGTSGNWTTVGDWATGTSAIALPGPDDQASSSSGATTIVNSVVPSVNELRFANFVAGTVLNTVNGIPYTSVGAATLDIEANGSLTIMSTDGNSNGNCIIGNGQPSSGTLIMNGGTLFLGSLAPNSQSSEFINGFESLVIADIADSTTAQGPTSVFQMNNGTVEVGNNFVTGFGATINPTTVDAARGTTTQTGGLAKVAGAVIVGARGYGTYSISGGSLIQTGTNGDSTAQGRDAFYVGQSNTTANRNNQGGHGTFTMSGSAKVSIANGLYIANQSYTTGNFTVAGGQLTINGPISVGAAFGAGVASNAPIAATNNPGRFQVIGNSGSITAQHLTADTANSTLGFTIQSNLGPSLISLSSASTPIAGFSDGAAIFSASTQIDLDPADGYTPLPGTVFELVRAQNNLTTIPLPTLVTDGDAFDQSTLSYRNNGNGTYSLIDTITPEPATLFLLVFPALLLSRRRR